jgi:hypothetical protein
MKNEELLPPLTQEQATNLVKFLAVNFDENEINYDNICCAEDGITDGHEMTLNTLRKAYGLTNE